MENKTLPKKLVKRIGLTLGLGAGIGILLLVFKLFSIMVVEHEFYQNKAISQQTRDSVVTAKRGTIYDRNGETLAVSASVETIYLSPNSIKNEEQANLIADGLSEILGIERDTLYAKTQKNNYSELLKRQVDKNTADAVRAFVRENNLSCISIIEDSKRYYPYGSMASHVIGFTNIDGEGLGGVELYYDEILTGTPGRIISAKTAAGTDMPFTYEKYVDAENGYNLVLTIDSVIQQIVEKHIANAMIENKIQNRATCIILDVNTFEVLAMTTQEDFDLNDPRALTEEQLAYLETLSGEAYSTAQMTMWQSLWRNKAVSDTYMPGSTFKLITSAMGLEDGVISTSSTFNCPGYHIVAGQRINCWKTNGSHGTQDLSKAIQNSCNPSFMIIGSLVGNESFKNYVSAFGLLERTGIDLPGEASGLFFSDANWNEVELATASFGQNFKVSPVQMITAVAAAVNGGYLGTPHVAKQVVDDDGNVIATYDNTIKRQVISEETSAIVRQLGEDVVTIGTGKNAYLAGYRIGGKTGTSEKTDERDENGQVTKRVSSFIGFAPADDPQIAILVIQDEPDLPVSQQGGGLISAPLAKNILADVLPYLGVAPDYTEEELAAMNKTVSNVVDQPVDEAAAALEALGLTVVVEGEGGTVVGQMPRGGQKLAEGGTVILYTTQDYIAQKNTVPDVLDCDPANAIEQLVAAGFNVNLTGADTDSSTVKVQNQYPQAGSEAEAGSIVTLEFIDTNVGD